MVKLPLFVDHMMVSVENPKEHIRKLFGLMSEFSKIIGYKISIQILIIFLSIGKECMNNKIKNTVPFIITQEYSDIGLVS